MRVQLVDPSAFTPPYDHALAGALARAGAHVELVTSRFLYGPVPREDGYRVNEAFYRRSAQLGLGSRARVPVKLAEHVPDMLRYRRHANRADVVHYQWLAVQQLDVALLAPKRPRVLTAHDILPKEPRRGQVAATRRLLRAMDAVVVHSEHGAERLRAEAGVDPARVHVIPHGAFDYLTRLPAEQPLPAELARVEQPVVLFFGLLRPYKGLDVLLDAWKGIGGAELWVVGNPRMPLRSLRARALRSLPLQASGSVRFVPRYVSDAELPAYFRRADLVVLPYREIDQSGVLFTALAFGKPLLLTSVGGFPEVADEGAAELVEPGDRAALHIALKRLLGDPARREVLAANAARAAATTYSWDGIAARHLELYRRLTAAAGQAAG
jgi:glycosyltransferase involved in cell wall biosynthesis